MAPTPPVILTEDVHLAIIGLGGVGAMRPATWIRAYGPLAVLGPDS